MVSSHLTGSIKMLKPATAKNMELLCRMENLNQLLKWQVFLMLEVKGAPLLLETET